jgi:Raf kinase inhibitor-like YbhB/YbcL family protein
MPARFATVNVEGGTGVSMPLEWDDVPEWTESFVLAVIDTHPVAHGWVHWLVTDIPGHLRSLPEGASRTRAMPGRSLEHHNTGGRAGYGGPQPPVGSGPHHYVVTLYALDTPDLGLSASTDWDEVSMEMEGHLLASASLTGTFEL